MAKRKSSTRLNIHHRRRAAAMRLVRAAGADALLVTRPQDVSYLTGFSGEDSFAYLADRRAVLITDGRFSEQAAIDCPDMEILTRTGRLSVAVGNLLAGDKPKRLAVQADHMSVLFYRSLAKAYDDKRLLPLTDVLAPLRMCKDDGELRAIRKAVRAGEEAFRRLIGRGRKGFIGKTERQVAAELDYYMRLAGADGAAFETIVAAGAHGSLPHYRPGDTRIRSDQAVLIDWGASLGGYCSDLTRVVFTGKIPPKLAEVYTVVLRAQRAGISACRPAVACSTADAAARDVIVRAGYGENFIHGLGHGIGLEVHEAPRLARDQKARLRQGMVVTVEPGVYLPGVGGVRIEDDILITSGGRRRLSSLPTEPAAMVLR